MSLLRVDEALASVSWPPLHEATTLLRATDVLVACAGFEDRALAFLRRSVEAGGGGFRVVRVTYLPAVSENRDQEMLDLVKRGGGSEVSLTYSRGEPEDSHSILDAAAPCERILIDVSGMSRLLIVQLCAAVVRRELLGRVELIYTEAEHYPPSREEVRSRIAEGQDYLGVMNFISSGVMGLTIVPELSTVSMQGQPVRLVAFPTFNPAQLATVCAEISAASYTIVHGVTPRPENSWRRESIRALNVIDGLREKEEVDTSTWDYRETLGVLLDLYARIGSSQKLVIAPTGSKMQSVAVGLACGFLHDLQIVYPTPLRFPNPSAYTSGARATYSLPLRSFSSVGR